LPFFSRSDTLQINGKQAMRNVPILLACGLAWPMAAGALLAQPLAGGQIVTLRPSV
jgi:hypothetical protein